MYSKISCRGVGFDCFSQLVHRTGGFQPQSSVMWQISLFWLTTVAVSPSDCLSAVGRWCYRSRPSPGADLWSKKSVWCHQGNKNSSALQHGVLPCEREFCSAHRQWWQGDDLGIKIQCFRQECPQQVMGCIFLIKASICYTCKWCVVFYCILKHHWWPCVFGSVTSALLVCDWKGEV